MTPTAEAFLSEWYFVKVGLSSQVTDSEKCNTTEKSNLVVIVSTAALCLLTHYIGAQHVCSTWKLLQKCPREQTAPGQAPCRQKHFINSLHKCRVLLDSGRSGDPYRELLSDFNKTCICSTYFPKNNPVSNLTKIRQVPCGRIDGQTDRLTWRSYMVYVQVQEQTGSPWASPLPPEALHQQFVQTWCPDCQWEIWRPRPWAVVTNRHHIWATQLGMILHKKP